jgi:uncharacterized damage-inducible protein DinB
MSAELVKQLKSSLSGELEQLRDAIKQLAEPLAEEEFWAKPGDRGNSVGNLCLHLTGNLNHFVGAQLGGTGYLREREREFTDNRPFPMATVLARLDEAVATFRRIVDGLTAEQLLAVHPHTAFGSVLNTLVHLVSHFALHRGQISYIARLVQSAG